MNIIKTTSYEGDYICSICRDNFNEQDQIYLVKHYNSQTQKAEKIDQCRGRKHIFHESCLTANMNYVSQAHRDNHPGDPDDCDHLCPLDREPIRELIAVKYSEVVALNILNFSHNYYELLNKTASRDIANVSITDKINLNYKDINGKTLLYCASQRGDLKLLKRLVQLGGDPTICDDLGFSPLMAIATHGFIDLIKYLLKNQNVIESLNFTDDKGRTVFDYADLYQRYNCLYELIASGGVKIERQTLTQLYCKYQNLRRPGYETIIPKIRQKLQKLLGIKTTTRVIKTLTTLKVSLDDSTLEDDNEDLVIVPSSKTVNIDPDRYPDLFNQIYQPRDLSSMRTQPREIY